MPPLKMSLNVFQFIRKEHHEEDQSDQYKRKQDKVKKVQIHLLNPGRVDSPMNDLSFSYHEEKSQDKNLSSLNSRVSATTFKI